MVPKDLQSLLNWTRLSFIAKIHASTINHDEGGAIRLGTDLRFVDSSKPWDAVGSSPSKSKPLLTWELEMGQGIRVR